MYAIIETGGKQYTVFEGDVLQVEKLDAQEGDQVSFDKVLFISDEEGLKVGDPYIENAKVEAQVEKQGKGKKIIVFKYKPKKHYKKKKGHRQPYTQVKISGIVK